jgi:plastocyanin
VRKEPAEKEKSANIVKHTSEGFKPVAITVNVGDTVTWTNEADEAMWPATDIHPIHRNYPGSDMKKCGTPEEKETFDSCRAVGKGESYSFTFSQKGSWNYHNHRSPSEKGVVVVLG